MLGTKVKCGAYLKKVKPINYVYANKQHVKNSYGEETENYLMLVSESVVFLDVVGDEYVQDTLKKEELEFEGIVIGRKKVPTQRRYSVASRAIFDPENYGFIDEEPIDEVAVENCGYQECYHIAFRMGGTRLVPIKETEVLE